MPTTRRSSRRKLIQHVDLRTTVIDYLKAGRTPEQIAGRMRVGCSPVRISHETTYQYIYCRDGHAMDTRRYLSDLRTPRRAAVGVGRNCNVRGRAGDLPQVRTCGSREEFGQRKRELVHFRRQFGATSFPRSSGSPGSLSFWKIPTRVSGR